MTTINIDIEDGEYPGLGLTIDWGGNLPNDADIMSLATAILGCDAVTHIPWIGTPIVNSVTTPSTHTIYPPE